MVTIYHLSDSDRCQDRHGRSFRRRGIIASYSEYKWQGSPGAQQQLEYLRACPLGSISPGQHPRARSDGRDIIPSGRGINNNTFDVGDGNVPAAWPPGSSGRNKGICSSCFFPSPRLRLGLLRVGQFQVKFHLCPGLTGPGRLARPGWPRLGS